MTFEVTTILRNNLKIYKKLVFSIFFDFYPADNGALKMQAILLTSAFLSILLGSANSKLSDYLHYRVRKFKTERKMVRLQFTCKARYAKRYIVLIFCFE